mgnify:CR=1 FL=1
MKELQEDVRERLDYLAGKGALLYGFPGVGKTSLVKQLAKDMNADMVIIEKDMSVRQIKNSFGYARKIAEEGKRVFIAIDEIDDFGSKEYSKYQPGGISKIIALMTEIDGLKTESRVRKNLYIFGITNYLENVDSRLLRPGRLEEVIEIPFPNKEERGRIIEYLMV